MSPSALASSIFIKSTHLMARADVYFALGCAFALLTLLVSPFWTYFGNVVLGLPCFGVSWLFWRAAQRADPGATRFRWLPYLWLASLGVALIALLLVK
jgi:hypothetical protein